jgi:hypothetical protein
MHHKKLTAIAAAIVAIAGIAASQSAGATVYGSLANFDIVNDTGRPAYGFEIEFEDSSFSKSQITSIFGYDRDFGLAGGPGAVVRFGTPVITDVPGFGVRITFGGTIGGVFTPFDNPASPYNTPGESCWPLGGGWSAAAPCDHYGVSTYGQPAVTRYKWLVEDQANPGTLVAVQAGIPAVQFVYTPPVQPAPGQGAFQPGAVNAVIQAVAPNREQPENEAMWGEAFWVKSFKTKVDHNIDLGDLLRGDDDQEEVETETEWEIFQKAPIGKQRGKKDIMEGVEEDVNEGDKAILRRYEFYKVVGLPVDEEGEVICDNDCEADPVGAGYVGAYVGAQMVGLNVNELAAPIQVPVPEPTTYAMLAAGLGFLGLVARRRR